MKMSAEELRQFHDTKAYKLLVDELNRIMDAAQAQMRGIDPEKSQCHVTLAREQQRYFLAMQLLGFVSKSS